MEVEDATDSGRSFTFYYGADGRVSSVLDSTGRSVGYGYNSSCAMTSATDAASRQTLYSYANGRYAPLLSQIKDHWNRVITDVTYDSADRTASYTDAGEVYTYTYNYQGNSNKTAKTDSAGKFWVYTFDSQGMVTSSVPPSGAGGGTSTTGYNPDGSIQYAIEEVGVQTAYTYNSNGSVATLTRDYQGALTVRFDYAYDSNFPEKVISITPKNPSTGAVNPDWQAWRYDYYQSGSAAPGALQHVYRIRSDGSTLDTLATYSYNSAGQVLSVTDATSAVTSYSYDATTGDLASVTYPKNSDAGANPVYQYDRDSAGRVTSVTDPLSNETSYTYDANDRILTTTLPKPSSSSTLNFTTTYSYDNFDSITGLLFTNQTDPNGKLTKQGYDQYGQLIKSIDALNSTTGFAYTKGLLSSITDANGNVTGYSYNALRQLTTTTFPDTATESYTYYADGLLKTKTDRKNQAITYTYDRLKRLTKKAYPNTKSITYTFVGQKLTTVADTLANETHSFTYDSSYRVATNTQGSRGTLNYTYDSADRAATYAVSGGGPTATFGYYSDGSLKTIDWSPVSGQFHNGYNLNGQYGSVSFPNGQHRDYTYDDQGRLLQIANIHPTAGNLATYDYGYDVNNSNGQNTMLGQRSSMNATVSSQSFNNHQTKYYYDNNYQLTQADYPNVSPFNAEIDSWTYDAIGNRLTSTVNASTQNYSYYKNGSNPNNGQRLQLDGTDTYTYDNNGNQITKTGGFTYTWDYENRLTGISGPGITASYSYDYLGRRISKTVNSVTMTYLYDGQNLIREVSASTADYVFGPGIDEPLAMSRSATIYYYNADGLGSINVLNDSAGTAQDEYVLDAWGTAKSQTTTVTNPFTYTSREITEAGLMYYRARYLSPGIGRFISEDSLRFRVGRNFYPLVNNRPINNSDPSGLASVGYSCKDRKDWIEKQIMQVRIKIKQCLPCQKERIEQILINVKIECASMIDRDDCAFYDGETNTIVLDLETVETKNGKFGCGCLKSIILHELGHALLPHETSQQVPELMEKKCFPNCSVVD